METTLRCWWYQCPNSDCNTVGLTNEVVLKHYYPDGRVPCTKCGTQMERLRVAEPGEYDQEKQQGLASRTQYQLQIRFLEPWETPPHLSCGMALVMCSGQHSAFPPSTRIRESGTSNAKDRPEALVEGAGFYTEEDVARTLGISVRVVRKLVKEGRLRACAPTKRKKLFTKDSIDGFIKREIGLSSSFNEPHSLVSRNPAPMCNQISLEESRSLMKSLRKNRSTEDRED